MILRRPLFALAVAAAVSPACRARERQRDARPTVAPLAPALGLANAAAFDVVVTAVGVIVARAPSAAEGGGVVVDRLDVSGARRGEATRLAPASEGAEVREIAAAASGDRIGVCWVEAASGKARTLAAITNAEGDVTSAPTVVAGSDDVAAAARSRLVVAAPALGRLRVLYRGAAVDCVSAGREPCVAFGFRELLGGPAARAEPWLSVPRPCPYGAVSAAATTARWFYAVCSKASGEAVTTAYSIDPVNAYARADEVLRGCSPLGMTSVQPGVVILGADCDGRRRGALLTEADSAPAEVDLSDGGLVCRSGKPTLRVAGFSAPLAAPQDRLEVILPQSVAPLGSRAVWAGSALVVVHATPGGLVTWRFRCLDETLVNL